MLCHVNVIPYNATGADFRSPTRAQALFFCERLRKERITATVRVSRGGEAEAACGQLRARLEADDAAGSENHA